MEDWQLLEDYAKRNSEEAFRQIADRYTGMVYHAALRQTGNAHTAEEITQAVFIALARKAGKVPRQTILAGWLFRAARFAVVNHHRAEESRRRHEQEAFDMQDPSLLQTSQPDPVWETIVTVLDDALERLPRADREALTLRYFTEKSHKEVAVALGVSEDAAKKRIGRALERLRGVFAGRGIHVASAALATTLSGNAAPAAPMGLSLTVAAIAMAKAPVAGSTGVLAASIARLMAWANIKSFGVWTLAVCFAAGTAAVSVHEVYQRRAADWEVPGFSTATLNRTRPQVTILPAKYPGLAKAAVSARNAEINGKDFARLMGLGVSLESMLQFAHHAGGMRHIVPQDLPNNHYDFIANLPTGSRAALAEAIRKQFGYVARVAAIEYTNALAIEFDHAGAPGINLITDRSPMKGEMRDGKRLLHNVTMTSFANSIEAVLNVPVFDQTGLSDHYDLEITLPPRSGGEAARLEWARKVLLQELGLKLVSSPGPRETLVIEKANSQASKDHENEPPRTRQERFHLD